jgi:hypothetical protein
VKWLRLLIVVLILMLNTVAIYASDTATVTVSLIPFVTGGISNFTITYINDSQIDLTWILGAGTDNIMVRGKYGEYPADIPNNITTPSDGYLVYYGNNLSASDVLVNLDDPGDANVSDTSDTPFTIYYKAWGQNSDGTWQTITLSGFEEGEIMLLIAILISCVGLTVGGFALRRAAIAMLGAGFWLANIVYCFVKTASMWDAYYVIGFISIAGVIVCVLDGAMILTHKEEKEEEQDDGLDPDVRELMKDRELMYRESNALRGRPTRHTEKKQAKGLLP